MQLLDIQKLLDCNFVPPHIYTYPPRKTFVNKDIFSRVNEVWESPDVQNELGLYVHIPFWKYKCVYCNLYAFEYDEQNDSLVDQYIHAICTQLRFHSSIFPQYKITSIQFGGGDPLLFGSKLLKMFIQTLDGVVPNWRETVTEFSVESTPFSVIQLNESAIRDIIQMGVNRINIGASPLMYDTNGTVKRVYDESCTYQAIQILQRASLKNISIDLMLGIHGELQEDWIDTMTRTVLLRPHTISFLPLTIRSDSLYGKDHRIGLMTSENYYEWYDIGKKILIDNGYKQQTVTRFVCDGGGNKQEDLHYSSGHIIGIGAGARSYNTIVDYFVSPEPFGMQGIQAYIKSMNLGDMDKMIRYSYLYTEEEKIRKSIVLSYNGFCLKDILKLPQKQVSKQIIDELNCLLERGFLYPHGDKYYFTEAGLKYHDIISLAFYSAAAINADCELWKQIL